jgi:hypothetical protein
MHDTQWCLREAQRIGPSCYALVHALFGDQVLIKLRAVQGVRRFAQQGNSLDALLPLLQLVTPVQPDIDN